MNVEVEIVDCEFDVIGKMVICMVLLVVVFLVFVLGIFFFVMICVIILFFNEVQCVMVSIVVGDLLQVV